MRRTHRPFTFIWLRITSLVLICCLCVSSTPAAPQTIVALANESALSFFFWFNNSGLRKLLHGQRAVATAKKQEKQSDRDAKINRIQIYPGDVTVNFGDRVIFSAVAYDQNASPISGVKIKWTAQSTDPKQKVLLSQRGELEATSAGIFIIVAEAKGRTAQATVTVRPGARRNINLTPTSTRQVSSRDVPDKKIGSVKQTKKDDSQRSVRRADQTAAVAKRAHAGSAKRTNPMTLPMPQGGGVGWDDSNSWSADKPENSVGNPPGAAADGGAGSGNFQFAAPVLSLPGRGMSVALGLSYNSRVWNKANSQMSFDNDRGWPAPGFSLGFGKLLGMGVYNGAMLVDADGTRHSYTGSITGFSWGTHGVMHTTDGSLIDYQYWTSTGGAMVNGQAQLPNGTIINYGATGPGGVFPTSIEDANGNFVAITYVNNSGPRIQTVTDSLNRTISFYYDANNLLTAITGPGLSGGSRTLVRLHYQQLNLAQYGNYGFSGAVSASARDSYPWVVDAIYYPATNTGYWFGDSDSYSSFGMLAKVVEERGMTFSGPDPVPPAQGPTDQGTITSAGLATRGETYNYPLTPDYSLIDAPTYTSMTETWTRDGSNFDSATTGYSVQENASPRTTAITLPNGTKNTQLAYNHPGQYDDGTIYYDETRDTNNNLLQSSSASWEQGAYGSPRPTRIEKTDEHQQTTAAAFSYGGFYNQVAEVRDYDYGGSALLRATRTTYQNTASYTGMAYSTGFVGRHIFNLPLSVQVVAADYSTPVSQTDYQYDGQSLSPAPNVAMHDDSADPYTTVTYDYCCDWEWDQLNSYEYCAQYCSQSVFDPSTNYRGNVTQVTTYADAIHLTGVVTQTRTYDITGNVVTASTSCCQQTTFNYSSNTQYAYPESKTRGSASDPYAQVTISATYDVNTALALSVTDANGRPSTTNYDSATLRVANANSPTGAYTDYVYDDVAMSIIATTHLAAGDGGGISDQNLKYLNGRGQVRHEQVLSPNSVWDHVDTVYGNMGQPLQQTRPYRSGETPVWITALYDALGRTTRVTAPDGSVTETYYNEEDFDPNDGYVPSRPDAASSAPGETTLVRDAWGRERWGRTDASGRLVEVVEPNPSGNGSVATGGLVTTYNYNTLGNLIQTNQGVQTRSFQYDALGRLTAQKLAEASATLNDAGAYTGSGSWSDVFTYDDRSNLTSRTDARGVKTVYGFNSDPLNRLQSVSWDMSGFGDTTNPIFPAATVTYQYQQKSSPSDLKDVTQVSGVTASGVSTESFGFDSEGRVSSKTLTLNSRPYYPFVTNYSFDSLDRVTDVLYPAEYGNGAQPRKVVHHDYDIASRIRNLTFDGQVFASNIVYNAASQTTSLNVGTGPNQVTENYIFNSQSGLLDGQTVVRGGSTLLNLSYDYTGANGKRTGQLTKILNNLDHNKDRGYAYDALGRLTQATGGPSGTLWTQTYGYDRWGNRTSVTATGHTARLEKPADPKAQLPTDLIAKNNSIELPEWLREKDKNPISDTSTPLYGRSSRTSLPKASKDAPSAPRVLPRIAFASTRDGSSQIYVMNSEGGNQLRLTNNQTNDESPRWSTNNSLIVFQSDRDNPFCDLYDIYVMNADGSGQTRLTSDPNDDSAPVWSPDGTKIAFQSMRNGANYQVYVMNADGSGQTNISNSSANDVQPAWSPDGSKIAFASDRDHTGVLAIYTMNSNGSGQTNISNNTTDDQQPAWSPDGSQLAFTSQRDSTTDTWTETDDDGNILNRSRVNINKEVYVMNANGSGQIRLTNSLDNDESPSWSSDGTTIVFRSDRQRDCCDPTPQVWMMYPDGGEQTDLSDSGTGDYSPNWQGSGGNIPPSVNINSPANGASFSAPSNITITASSSDADGYVTRVDFYNGGNLVGTATSAPFTINWNNVAAGSYSITARATDNAGATTTSSPISITVGAPAIPTDGITSASYNQTNNQITTAGFAYDAAGNQVRAIIPGGSASQRFKYDAANRMVQVLTDNNSTALASYTYGDSNERLTSDEGGYRTYFDFVGSSTIAEYVESDSSTVPKWSKSYVYLGLRLLSTLTPNGAGGDAVQYHHPDRLGTRLVTNPGDGTFFEQQTLPFGTALNESPPSGGIAGATNHRFTTYDRSATTGLDYAYNRNYDAQQGRFTQVDPVGIGMSDLENPQTLNLYSYCANDPVNHVDSSGLGFLSFVKKVFKVINNILKWVAIVVAIALAVVVTFAVLSLPGASFLADLFFSAADLLVKGLVKIGIMSFAEGGATIGAHAIIVGAIGGGLEVVNALAAQEKQPPGKTLRRMQKEARRQGRPRRIPRVRIPGDDKPIDPNPEPPKGIPETRTPSPPNPRPINPEEPTLPRNPTLWQRFKFGTAELLRIIGRTSGDIVIMMDPAELARVACEENPRSEDCREMLKWLPPEERCKYVRCIKT